MAKHARRASLTARSRTGINEKKATKIFDLMEHFAGYGFNKSHSTAYAFLAYQTAYLKANYPWHFMAALLTIEAQNTDKLALYLGECRERGVPVLPPDINDSELHVHGRAGRGRPLRPDRDQERRRGRDRVAARRRARSSGAIRVAPRALRGSRPAAGEQARVREPGQGRRVRLARRRRRAWTTQPPTSRRAAAARRHRSRACEHGGRHQRDREQGQSQLFGGDATAATSDELRAAAAAPPWTEDGAAGGREGNARPVLERPPGRALRATAPGKAARRAATQRPTLGDRRRAAATAPMAGIVIAAAAAQDAKGDRMAVFTLEDRSGGVEVIVFPEPFKQFARADRERRAWCWCAASSSATTSRRRILATEIVPLESVRERLVARSVRIRCQAPPHDRDTFEALGDVFARHRGDRRVAVRAASAAAIRPGRCASRPTSPQIRVRPSDELVAEVEQICGPGLGGAPR